jgi:predicted RNase H-like HicB family nuclease
MKLTLEVERMADGRFRAEVPEFPGLVAYGRSEEAAASAAKALSFRVLAERLEAGSISSVVVQDVSFGD